MDNNSLAIRTLNDQFRRSLQGGRVVMTAGVNALGALRVLHLLEIVRAFDQFDADNDPLGEHDFGSFNDGAERFFFKVDYYDLDCQFGSEDPADPAKTTRVLTLMLADEY